MISNPVLTAAFRRALLLAALTGAASFISSRQQGLGWEAAIYAGLAVAITGLVSRLGLEGMYDSNRARTDNVNAGDVPMAATGITVSKP